MAVFFFALIPRLTLRKEQPLSILIQKFVLYTFAQVQLLSLFDTPLHRQDWMVGGKDNLVLSARIHELNTLRRKILGGIGH